VNGQPEPACLVIADISGYTGYLAGVELDHAQDILADLVSTVVAALRPTLRLAKLEGDAAFAYVATERIEASQLQETVEATYFAFRRRLRDIGAASRCECNACIRIPALDLKTVVHHGPIVRQRIAGREELLGSNVILVHRLLKNDVVESMGFDAYALYTQACVDAMGLGDPARQGLVPHRVATDVAGDVDCWVGDLHAAWDAEQARRRHVVEGREVLASWSWETPAAPQIAWEYITSPIRRPEWNADAIIEQSATGRRGAGTVNHCIHGRDAIIEEILDYRPYEHITTRSQLPAPGAPKLTSSQVLTALPDGGTRIEFRLARARPKDRAAVEAIVPMIEGMVHHGAETLRPLLAAAAAERVESEPVDVRGGDGRFLSEPLTA
jgi:hypothetical protein